MSDSPAQSKFSNAIVVALSVVLVLGAIGAAYLINKSSSEAKAAQDQVASLTGQLEDAQREISELKPLANKARTLPVTFRIDRHALSAGYTLYTFNRSRESLRFHVSIEGGKSFPNVVIDGGKFWQLRGLASGDKVTVSSTGYDDKTVNIQ
jgi:hypothetical protein